MTEAVKNRIMTHMNKDHTKNLSQYLQYYCAVPVNEISHPQMVTISDEGMTIVGNADLCHHEQEEHFVAFEPALIGLEGIRPRVIEMAKEAEEGLKQGKTASS